MIPSERNQAFHGDQALVPLKASSGITFDAELVEALPRVDNT